MSTSDRIVVCQRFVPRCIALTQPLLRCLSIVVSRVRAVLFSVRRAHAPAFLRGSALGVSQCQDSKKSKSQAALKGAAQGVFAQTEVARRRLWKHLEVRQLLSSTWFVAPWGSNTNAGTIGAPFQTIQQAANVARPGDDVEIRAGVYDETVTPRNSGTAFSPHHLRSLQRRNVTISGASPISGWNDYSGSIYSAPMPVDLARETMSLRQRVGHQ